MGRAQQFLVPGKGGLSYVDTFGAVSPRWVLRAGTLAAGLQAATAGDWLWNAIANGEFTTNTTGWAGVNGGVITQVDSSVTPGVVSPGVTPGALRVASGGATSSCGSNSGSMLATIAGALYRLTTLAYSPSGNTAVNVGFMLPVGFTTSGAAVTSEDAWQILQTIDVATSATGYLQLRANSATAGDIAYFDAVTAYRRNAVTTLNWGSPNIVATLDLVIPAAPSVVPFSAIFRYTDALNYWEIRTTPNTAGNDLEIVEVVAGVATQRAAADIDWTAGQTDQMRVTVRGTSIAVEHKKFGAGTWTAGASYATMATGLTATAHGLMFFGTGVNRCTRWESH